MPARPEAGALLRRYLLLGHHVTCCMKRHTIIHAREEASQATHLRCWDFATRNVPCHKAFDRRWSVCAWLGQVNAWRDLAVSGQCLSTRRMRLKLLPEALVREELPRRDDLESIGTAQKRSMTPGGRRHEETDSGARTASAPEPFFSVRQKVI